MAIQPESLFSEIGGDSSKDLYIANHVSAGQIILYLTRRVILLIADLKIVIS